MVSIRDLSLPEVKLGPELQSLREAYFRAMPEVCVERVSFIMKFSVEVGLFVCDRIAPLEKARLYRKVLEHRRPVVWHSKGHTRTASGPQEFSFVDSSPFAGSTTSKFKGVPLYPEFMALALWPELWTMSRRNSNPYFISEKDIQTLNSDVFPYWMDSNITELTRRRGTDEDRQRMQLLQKMVFFLASKPNCISHTIPDFSRAIGEGLRVVINDALKRQEGATDQRRKDFYQALAEVLEGTIAYAHNLADAASGMATPESDPARKSALKEIAQVYGRVPERPAQSFREGLTTVWLCWTAVHLENANVGLSLGRLDQVLYQLYRKDIEAKRLTVEEAVQLVSHLWLKIGDHVPTVPAAGEQLFGGTGSNQAITIGGVDTEERDAVNDLTYVMLRATELMKLRDPNLNARYLPGVNEKSYLRRLCQANLSTGATPALHNDRAVIQTLVKSGNTLTQARDYGVIGCVELGSSGRFYGHSGAILLNLPSVLELAVFNGRHRHFGLDSKKVISVETGDPTSFVSFVQFKEAFKKQLQWVLDQAIALNDALGRTHQQFYPTPILSALFEGPMETGMDLIEGGAKLNGSGIAVIGLADVADSLNALETVVYGEPRDFTLYEALRREYQGYDALLARLRNPEKTPRFGNDADAADSNAIWLVRILHEATSGRRNYRGGCYHVGFWSMTNHAGFGRFIGATPNGRKGGENFASGLTPCSGVTPALTPALCSVAKLPVECVPNGMAVNLKFTPDDGDAQHMLDNFAAAVAGYFDLGADHGTGGMEIQFNVTSHRDFIAAVQDPSRYQELLVRVSGYTAYFKDLNPRMQKEIIDRTEYQLSSGRAVPYDPFPLPTGGNYGS